MQSCKDWACSRCTGQAWWQVPRNVHLPTTLTRWKAYAGWRDGGRGPPTHSQAPSAQTGATGAGRPGRPGCYPPAGTRWAPHCACAGVESASDLHPMVGSSSSQGTYICAGSSCCLWMRHAWEATTQDHSMPRRVSRRVSETTTSRAEPCRLCGKRQPLIAEVA